MRWQALLLIACSVLAALAFRMLWTGSETDLLEAADAHWESASRERARAASRWYRDQVGDIRLLASSWALVAPSRDLVGGRTDATAVLEKALAQALQEHDYDALAVRASDGTTLAASGDASLLPGVHIDPSFTPLRTATPTVTLFRSDEQELLALITPLDGFDADAGLALVTVHDVTKVQQRLLDGLPAEEGVSLTLEPDPLTPVSADVLRSHVRYVWPVPDSPWTLSTLVEKEMAYAAWYERRRTLALAMVLVGATTALSLLAVFLWRARNDRDRVIAHERALREEWEVHEAALEQISEQVFLIDRDARLVWTNVAGHEVLRDRARSRSTLTLDTAMPISPGQQTADPDLNGTWKSRARLAIDENREFAFDELLVRRDGRTRVLAGTILPLAPERTHAGVRYAVVCVRDRTRETRSKKNLAKERRRYQRVFDHYPNPVMTVRDGHIVLINRRAASLCPAHGAEDLKGKALNSVLTLETESAAQSSVHTLAEGCDDLPAVFHAPDARDVRVRVSSIPLEEAGGGAFLLHLRLVEELTRLEASLQEKQELLDRTERLMNMGSFRWHPGTDRLSWSGGFSRILGLGPGARSEQPLDALGQFLTPATLKRVRAKLVDPEALQDDQVLSVSVTGADGAVRDCTLRLFGSEVRKPEAEVRGTLVDVTAEKRAQRQRWRLHSAIEQLDDALLVTDTRGIVGFVNRAGAKLLGAKPGEILGEHALRLARPARPHGVTHEIARALRDAQSWEGDLTWKADTGATHALHARIAPLWDEQGVVDGFLALVRDVTDAREVQAHLEQAQRLGTLGQLVGSVAHDFNNMLTVISSHSFLLSQRETLSEPARADLHAIQHAAESSAKLTSQLLSFARRTPVEPRNMNLGEAMSAALPLLQRLLGKAVKLEFEPPLEDLRAHLDPVQLDQVLTNLCVNARDAIQDAGHKHGVIRLRLTRERLDEEDAGAVLGDPAPGEYVVLTVEDNGTGMDAEVVRRAFDPFFTTKARGRGTGLGLSSVFGIATQNRGGVRVVSQPGEGTALSLLLPLVATSTAAAEDATLPRGSGERILIVDDEPMMRELAAEIVESLGYSPTVVADGDEALALLDSDEAGFALLLTDVVMPRMPGPELVAAARRAGHDLPVLYMSGHADARLGGSPGTTGSASLVHKPFTPSALARSIRSAMPYARS